VHVFDYVREMLERTVLNQLIR